MAKLNRAKPVPTSGTLNLIAGTREAGFAGDGGPATQAKLWAPDALAVDKDDNLYIADAYNHRIRKLSPAPGPSLSGSGLLNAASFTAGAAPEAWISAFGSNLAAGSDSELGSSLDWKKVRDVAESAVMAAYLESQAPVRPGRR